MCETIRTNRRVVSSSEIVRWSTSKISNSDWFRVSSELYLFSPVERSIGYFLITTAFVYEYNFNYSIQLETFLLLFFFFSKTIRKAKNTFKKIIHVNTRKDFLLQLIMGGGRAKFLSKTTSEGQRIDGRNLIDEWLNINRTGLHSAYVSDRSALNSINTHETDYLLGNENK